MLGIPNKTWTVDQCLLCGEQAKNYLDRSCCAFLTTFHEVAFIVIGLQYSRYMPGMGQVHCSNMSSRGDIDEETPTTTTITTFLHKHAHEQHQDDFCTSKEQSHLH